MGSLKYIGTISYREGSDCSVGLRVNDRDIIAQIIGHIGPSPCGVNRDAVRAGSHLYSGDYLVGASVYHGDVIALIVGHIDSAAGRIDCHTAGAISTVTLAITACVLASITERLSLP